MLPLRIIELVRERRLTWVIIGSALLACFLAHLLIGGALGFDLPQLWSALLAGPGSDHPWTAVIWQIRLPRALACIFVGAILGSVGSTFQLLFRNPLAEPFVIGVSGGAAVGGTLLVGSGVAGLVLEYGVLFAAVAGGLASLALVLAFGSRKPTFHSETVLIVGAVVGTTLMSLMTLILLSRGNDSSTVLRWLLGSMTPMFWGRTFVLALVFGVGFVLLFQRSRVMNALSLGEVTAHTLGTDPKRVARSLLTTGTLMSSAAVGAVGIIGFLGMLAPNIARALVGPDARRTLPLSAAIGAALLLIADLAAQRLITGQELPVGAITAVIGAPGLLWILRAKP